jgi:uncharacterized protein involved in outer membrane biogenesis
MRAARSVGCVALACMLVLLALGTALYWVAAHGYLKQPVTRWLGAQLGRAVTIDGDLRVEFGPVTRFSATGLRLANVSWGSRPHMLVARYVLLDLDTRSLLRNTVVIRKLVVAGLDLDLERNAMGQNNWTFNWQRRRPSAEIPLIVESAALPGARIRFAGPRLERALEVALDTLDQTERANGMLDLTVRGAANLTPVDVRISVGPFANLLAARDFSVQADGRLGDIALGINGHVDSLEAPANSEATLSLKAPDATYLAAHLGLRSLGGGPVTLEMAVSPFAGGTGIQGRVSGQIGQFAVTGQGSYVQKAKITNISVQAQVTGPDLSRVGHITGIRGLPPEPFHLQVDVQRSGDTVRIQKADLGLADGRVMVSGFLGPGGALAGSELAFTVSTPDVAKIEQRLGMANFLTGPFDATGTMHHSKPGETRLSVNGTSTLGKFSVAGPVGRAPEYYGTRLAFNASGADLAPLGRALKLTESLVGAFKGAGTVEWSSLGLALRGASLTVADESLSVDGSLGKPPFARGGDIHFDLSGGNAARLAERFGVSGFPATSYRVLGRIQRDKDRLLLSKVKLTAGHAAMALDGILGDPPQLSATSLDFAVTGSALEDFAGLFPSATLPRGKFRAGGHVSAANETLQIRDAQVSVADAQGTISASAALPFSSGSLQFDFEAKVPDLAALFPGSADAAAVTKDVEVLVVGSRLKERWSLERLRVANGSDFISALGELDLSPQLAAHNVRLQVHVANLRNAGLPSGHKWPDQPLELSATLSRFDRDLILDDLNGRLGSSDFTGRIEAHGLGGTPDFDVHIGSKQLDISPYVDTPMGPTLPTPGGANRSRSDKRPIIPAADVRLPDFNGFTGKIALRAQALRLRDLDFRDLQIVATVRDGHVHVDPLKMSGAAGQVDARIDLVAKDKRVIAQVSGTATNLRLSPLLIRASGPNDTVYSARIELQGSGSTLREIAGTLNGRLRLVGEGGRLANSGLMASSNDFAKQLLSSINPLASRQPTTEVVCVAYLLNAKDGVVTTDPALVMRTAGLDIISNGLVDLHTEKIDFSFKIAGRKGLGFGVAQLINPYLKVTGTLGKPGFTVDPTGALVNGGAAFATAGLSVVATTLWDRIIHENDPCAAAVGHSDRRKWN